MEDSFLKKAIDATLTVLALILAIAFYYAFDLENILWGKRENVTVTQEQIEENRAQDYSGKIAGEGIPEIKTIEDWEKSSTVDYVVVTPKSLKMTNVYKLANWADHYTKRRTGGAGRKRNEVQTQIFDFDSNYRRYYVIELEDGTHLLAQMNRGIAQKIERGEEIALPLGRKAAIPSQAKNLLSSLIDELDISTDYSLYTIDDNWSKSTTNKIFFIKFGISTVLFFAVAVALLTIVEKIFFKKG